MVGTLGFLIACVLMTGTLTACSSTQKSERVRLAKLEQRLRRANNKIETLRDQNAVLKNRIKIAKENAGDTGAGNGTDPQLAVEALAAFKPGVQLEVPVAETSARGSSVKRQDVSLIPQSLPKKRAVKMAKASRGLAADAPSSERADRVLARTVADLLKNGDSLEAERTAALLEKSYPDSELIAETRFQQGLYFFRQKNLSQADRLFQATLKSPKAHVRAKAGAILMRGIIARRLATEGAAAGRKETIVQTNLALSRKTFAYVRKAFPGSPEAARAGRELRALNSSPVNASRVK